MKKILRTTSSSANQFNYKYSKARKRLFKDELELNSISLKYQKNSESYAIKDFNLTLKRGDFIAIMGPSGAGKSTIIDAIMGLIKPQSGYIKVDGKFIYKDNTFFNLKEWQQLRTFLKMFIYLIKLLSKIFY